MIINNLHWKKNLKSLYNLMNKKIGRELLIIIKIKIYMKD